MTDFTETFNKTGTANEDKLNGKKSDPPRPDNREPEGLAALSIHQRDRMAVREVAVAAARRSAGGHAAWAGEHQRRSY